MGLKTASLEVLSGGNKDKAKNMLKSKKQTNGKRLE
jgi:hypothetical protein